MPDRCSAFPAYLRYWRHRRGLSQLDLSLIAKVSSRHVSFLETGRSRPSVAMVRRLAGALALSLREQNRLLESAGHPPRFEDPDADLVPPEVLDVLQQWIAKLQPWPAMVIDRSYTLVTANAQARAMLQRLIADPSALVAPINLGDALFDPRLSRSFVEDWEALAARILARLHQTVLLGGADEALSALIERLLAYPGVPEDWRMPDFSQSTQPLLPMRLRLRDGTRLSFLATLTAFSDPRRRAVEELQIETYFPQDAATVDFLASLV